MGMAITYTPEQIVALLQTHTNAEVGEIINRHPVTVSRMRRLYNIPGRTGRPKELKELVCGYCGESFMPLYAGRKFCSIVCRAKRYGAESAIQMKAGRTTNHRTVERGWGSWLKKDTTPEFRKYANKVHRITRSIYNKYQTVINPHNHPRTLAGVDGGYQLDHVVSARHGFDMGWPPERIACIENLQMLPWRTNIVKGK